jgi:MarR family transcriptional regulator, organic hydroperoxide resistance regulator
MDMAPADIALQFFEIAGPIFVSLKEQVHPANIKARSHPAAKELTFTQLRILLAIEYGKNQVGKLARSARVAQPAMSKIVDHLIRGGFVRRDPHSSDRRKIILSLTAKGIATTLRIRMKAAEKYVSAIEALSPNEKRKLAEGLSVISKVIEDSRKESE